MASTMISYPSIKAGGNEYVLRVKPSAPQLRNSGAPYNCMMHTAATSPASAPIAGMADTMTKAAKGNGEFVAGTDHYER